MNENIKEKLEGMIGMSTGPRTLSYTWRDTILYALGVGAHAEDLPYVYEKGGFKALPTFGAITYLNSIMMQPRKQMPYNPHTLVKELIARETGSEPRGLHMDMDIVMHNPIDPFAGTLMIDDQVLDIYDRGEGKGIAIKTQMKVYDTAGIPVCTLSGLHGTFIYGGFGGKKAPSNKVQFPERAPDVVVEDQMQDTQALLYRLMGDTYDVHVDYKLCQSKGFEKPFMQGLCSWGYACRMATQAYVPYEPERVTHFYAQMRSLCFPGSKVTLQAWELEKGKVVFKLLNDEGKAVLDNGVFEYKA